MSRIARAVLILACAVLSAGTTLTSRAAQAAGITVTPTSGLTTTEAGGTAQFTVVLDTQPTDNVTIGVASSDVTEGILSTASLTFTPGDWSTPQTVTITGVDDPVDDGDIVYSIVTAAATSNDLAYGGLDPADVSVTNIDNDVAGITVNPTVGLTTTEVGGTAQFTVVLTSQPIANVAIGLSSSDLTEGTVAPASVTFTSGNWNVAQTVTVTGVDDAVVDGNIAYTILTGLATSSDPNYNGRDPANVAVTNTDNDVAGITVNPTVGLTTTEVGGTAQFTVVLTSQPIANVAIGLSSSDLTEGTVAPASVTFTSANWNVAQTVTVTGVDDAVVDGNIAYTILTGLATSADPNYNGRDPANVAVTNNDNDVAGITVNPTSGLVTTEVGGTAQFTVVLTSQPIANVAIGLSSSDLTEGTVAPASVTFTSANWNVAQTVTVTGVDDAVVDGNITYAILTGLASSADPNYNGRDPADVAVTNNDNDAAGITVNPTVGLTTTEVGGTAQFTVVLTSQPIANVAIGLSSSDLTEGTVAPASVTFTSANWNVAQTVTVTGVDDAVVDGNIAYTILTGLATSADPNYNGRDPANVAVTNNDNDVAGITVNPTSGLVTTEVGGTSQFTVVLTSQPIANVAIGLSSSDLTEGTVAPASVTFTSGNWNVAQTVTVTGVDDAVVDGPIAYTIVTAAAASTDPNYNGRDPANVAVTNNDNDAAGFTVVPLTGLLTTEAGGTAQFAVALTSQPSADVNIGILSSDVTEGSVAPASLTFTSANWNVAQMVIVTGVDDFLDDGNIAYSVFVLPATSLDPIYNGLNPPNPALTNIDNDVAGITVNPTTGLTTTEAGGIAQFTVVLTSQPIANVTMGFSSSDLTEGTVAPASITFTALNWSTPQTVTVTGVDDPAVDGAITYAIVTAAAISTDIGYNGQDPANVEVTNTDNDAAGFTVNPTAGLATTEAGGTAQFTVVLTSQPSANVAFGLSSTDLTEGTVAPAGLTFTPADWNVAQMVTVTGVDDPAVDGPIAYTIVTTAASSVDPNYHGLNPADVSVSNSDNDMAGITVNPAAGLITTEAGGTAQFTVVINTQPAADISIGLSSTDLTEGTVAPASLTFTPANWNLAQTVTVTGVDDPAVDGAIAYTIVTGLAVTIDPNYNGLNPANVSVTNTDNDAAGVTVNPIAGLITTEAGGTAQFTVVLTSQPAANVSIGLSSTDLTEGTVAPGSLTFNALNWSTPRTVTVTGVDDPGVDGAIAYTIVTAAALSADVNYTGLNPEDVAVTNTDNDAAGITVNPTAGLVTSEVGGTAQFAVALNSQPTADVAIGFTSSDLTEGTVAPPGLTFTPANWNVPQTVTITGVDDLIDDGNIIYTITTSAASSTDPNYNGQDPANVSVTNTDNDAAGISVNPTAGLITTEVGGSAQFTVVLNSQPTANVTTGLSSNDLTEGTVAPASLTFTTADWNVPQTVIVTGVDDFLDDGNIGYSILTAPATSTDPSYNSRNPLNVAVTNTDDDTAGITVDPTAGLVTTESGGTAQFIVVLHSQPTANVTIALTSSDLTEGTVSPASLTFTGADWNIAQAATVTGVDDPAVDGGIAYTIVTAPATSTDVIYNGQDPPNVSATNIDNDAAGIWVSPVAGLITTEAGGTAHFNVVLASQPTASVTFGLSTTDATEGTVTPTSLTFTPANWNAPRIVSVTGVDDFLDDGDIAYLIQTTPATSVDPAYNGQNPADVGVTNQDDDTGSAVVLELVADRERVEPGRPVRYTLAIRNPTKLDVTNLQIQHELPPRFGYLAGSAARDGRAIADPAGTRLQRFQLDTLPAFVDQDGDGAPGPGERGYTTFSWTLAPGASATPGTYRNSAVAVAIRACSSCVISNRAEASVRVEEDGVFARGTVLGRVFEDTNRDGRLGATEHGVGGAIIALDDGTRVTTDDQGRFHVPDLESGPRILKLDLAALGIPATPTTDVTQVVNVSPGLLATARFGVWFARDTVTIGGPEAEGLAIVTDELEHAVHIAGNAYRTAVIVNGRPVGVRSLDARLNPDGSEELVRLVADSLESHALFHTEVGDTNGVVRWWLEIRSPHNEVVQMFEGRGAPPPNIEWDGSMTGGRQMRGGEVYAYQLSAEFADGDVAQGPRRMFGADRWTSIAQTLGGDAFPGGGTVLSAPAMDALSRVARAMRLSRREVVVIEGHTDSIGSADANRLLSRQRAEAVLDYLVARERIPRGRLVVEAHGESRPVASNDTEGGRELNRRVEIYGMATEVRRAWLYDVVHSDASARVGAVEVPIDSTGHFSVELPVLGNDTLEVALTNRRGRIGIARLRLPSLAIDEPRGEVRLPFGESANGVKVEPRAALEGESEPMASLVASAGERPAAHARLRGRTDSGNRVEVDGVPLEVGADGAFTTELTLHVGENAFGVMARDPKGTQRLASLLVRVLDRGPDGGRLLAVARIPDLIVHLPPAGAVLFTRELRLAGHTRPGYRVLVNRDTLEVDADGAFSGRTTLPEGKSVLKVTVVDSVGNHGVVEREIEAQSKRLFLVALADGVVGRTRGRGFVGTRGESRTWTEGRLAYQLKGWIAGRYLINSALDTRRRDFGSLFRDLDDAGRDRLLVNLDPDRLYPVFGDSSVVTNGGTGGGRFFLAVESEVVRASVGDFPIALDEVELASFHRTLYGAQLRLGAQPLEKGSSGKTSVALFGAEAKTLHVRDAIRATGGTLYYLSHGEVIEGSVQVALVVNDRDTGLPLRRIPLQRGREYTAKELEGRLLFTRPVPGVWEDGSLVSGDPLSGHPVTIEVDYETRGSLGEKSAIGARVRQGVGPLTVGATVVDDEAGASHYQLKGGDATVRLGDTSRLGFELAESEGRVGRTFASDDGGLAFAPADTAGVRSGRAWKLAAELAPGEWLERADRVRLGAYVKRVESGFASQDRSAGEALEQFGLRGQFDAGRWGLWSARFDQDARGKSDSTAGRSRDVFGLHWRREGRRSGVAGEFDQRSMSGWGATDSSASSVAGRFWWWPFERVRTSLERRQSVSGPAQDRTALGLDWQVLPKLTLGARGSDGTTGSELRGDATLSLGKNSAYVREERLDEFGRRRSGTLFGVQAPLGAAGRTYTEYQWQRDAAGERALSVLGVEQGWRNSNGFAWRVAGEHGNRAGVPGLGPAGVVTGVAGGAAAGQRTTLSSDLSYRGRLPVSGTTRGEYRVEKGASRQKQFLSSSHVEWALVAGFALHGDYRLSVTRQLDLGLTPARFEESSLGLAYRPARSDRVQGLARWTRLADRRLRGPADSLSSESGLDVAALEASVRFTQTLEWSGKGAARIMRDGGAGLPSVATHGTLWINRFDYAFMRPMRFGVEYRLLSQRETGDNSRGWLQEVSWDPATHFRVGLGYNFTRFSGDLLDRGQENAKGWFVRAQSRY